MTDFIPRNRREESLYAVTRGTISACGYSLAAWCGADVQIVADIFRRSAARRRRGKRVKAVRRERFRYFVNVLATVEADARRETEGKRAALAPAPSSTGEVMP